MDPKNTILTSALLKTIKPMQLLALLDAQYKITGAEGIESCDDLKKASEIMKTCIANYAFLTNMVMVANYLKRRCKLRTPEHEDAVLRETYLINYADYQKKLYELTSRLITIRQMQNEELHMSDSRYK